MVTANPAKTLHWTEVGSIEPGKVADLLLITRPDHVSAEQLPPYAEESRLWDGYSAASLAFMQVISHGSL
jgi:imidazolonepropionase-like amidohydrolase